MVKFTKASKNDNGKVTTRVSTLFDNFVGKTDPLTLSKIFKQLSTSGTQVILEVEGVPTLFHVNRAGSTLATNAFPAKLRRPQVSHAVNYKVTGIQVVERALGVGI